MSNETHGIPQRGSGGLIAVGILLLIAAGGLVFWKLQNTEAEIDGLPLPPPVVETLDSPKAQLNNAPPPPPPPEEDESPEGSVQSARSTKKAPQTKDSCSGECNGNVTAILRSALAKRAASARSCYNTALRRNSALQGKVTVSVRVARNGRTCSAKITASTLGDAAVESCVAQKFRAGSFPPARGGCVNAAVPINFTKAP